MKAKIVNPLTQPELLAPFDMKGGQIGVIESSATGSSRVGELVLRAGGNSVPALILLSDPGVHWTDLHSLSFKIRLLPRGTKVELEVE